MMWLTCSAKVQFLKGYPYRISSLTILQHPQQPQKFSCKNHTSAVSILTEQDFIKSTFTKNYPQSQDFFPVVYKTQKYHKNFIHLRLKAFNVTCLLSLKFNFPCIRLIVCSFNCQSIKLYVSWIWLHIKLKIHIFLMIFAHKTFLFKKVIKLMHLSMLCLKQQANPGE